MYKCSKCGREYEGNFCPECGEKKPRNNFCPNCGKPIEDGKSCPYCGFDLQPAATSSVQKTQAAKYYKILSVLPAVFTALFAVLTILAFFVMPAVTVFGLPSEALFEDFKVNGILGYECLDGAAGATLVFGFVALALSVGLFVCVAAKPFKGATVKIKGRETEVSLILTIISAVIAFAQLITSAVCMGIIAADDGGLGLISSNAGLVVPLVFSLLCVIALPACVSVNKFVILRRNPEARFASAYFEARNEFSSAIPAPEVKENSELYSRCVKFYSLKTALLFCNIFFIYSLIAFFSAIMRSYMAASNWVMFVVLIVGLTLSIVFAVLGRKRAKSRFNEIKDVNNMLTKRVAFCFTAVIGTLFGVPWYIMSGIKSMYGGSLYVTFFVDGTSSFAFILFAFSVIYCCAVAISLVLNGKKIDKLIFEKTERPRCARKLKWWWYIIPYFDAYAIIVGIINCAHYCKAEKKAIMSEEEFKNQSVIYGEYVEYRKRLAIYSYNAYTYAKERLAGKSPDITATADAAAGKVKVWLYDNAAYILLAAVAVVSFVVAIAVAAGA